MESSWVRERQAASQEELSSVDLVGWLVKYGDTDQVMNAVIFSEFPYHSSHVVSVEHAVGITLGTWYRSIWCFLRLSVYLAWRRADRLAKRGLVNVCRQSLYLVCRALRQQISHSSLCAYILAAVTHFNHHLCRKSSAQDVLRRKQRKCSIVSTVNKHEPHRGTLISEWNIFFTAFSCISVWVVTRRFSYFIARKTLVCGTCCRAGMYWHRVSCFLSSAPTNFRVTCITIWFGP
jgi:hypothetical protein